jgi:hypothetical protein
MAEQIGRQAQDFNKGFITGLPFIPINLVKASTTAKEVKELQCK